MVSLFFNLSVTALLIAPLLCFSGFVSAVPSLDPKHQLEVTLDTDAGSSSYTVIRDYSDIAKWYYVPNEPRLSHHLANGESIPDFRLIRYSYRDPSNSDDLLQGGILQVGVQLGLVGETKNQLAEAVRRQARTGKVNLSALPLKSASAYVQTGSGDFVTSVSGTRSGIAPTHSTQKMFFQMNLSRLGSDIYQELTNESGGGVPIYFEYLYEGRSPQANLNVSVNWDRAYEYSANSKTSGVAGSVSYKNFSVGGSKSNHISTLREQYESNEIINVSGEATREMPQEKITELLAPILIRIHSIIDRDHNNIGAQAPKNNASPPKIGDANRPATRKPRQSKKPERPKRKKGVPIAGLKESEPSDTALLGINVSNETPDPQRKQASDTTRSGKKPERPKRKKGAPMKESEPSDTALRGKNVSNETPDPQQNQASETTHSAPEKAETKNPPRRGAPERSHRTGKSSTASNDKVDSKKIAENLSDAAQSAATSALGGVAADLGGDIRFTDDTTQQEIERTLKGTINYDFSFSSILERPGSVSGVLGLGAYSDEIKRRLITDVPFGDWQNAYFTLPPVGDSANVGIRHVGMEVELRAGGKSIVRQVASWNPGSNWTDHKGRSTSLLNFPLMGRVAAGLDLETAEFHSRTEISYGTTVLEVNRAHNVVNGETRISDPWQAINLITISGTRLLWSQFDPDYSDLAVVNVRMAQGNKVFSGVIQPRQVEGGWQVPTELHWLVDKDGGDVDIDIEGVLISGTRIYWEGNGANLLQRVGNRVELLNGSWQLE